jgi:phospholipase C
VNDGGGPSWVASIVNAIGTSTSCDGNAGYWEDTAIFVVWDDWGGWYDHEPPTILAQPEGGYQYGFRVPLVVVSAYTPEGYINNQRHDFGSILKFIEFNFNLPVGGLDFADARSNTNLTGFFDLAKKPRTFQTISAAKDAAFFLNDTRTATDPDDDQ